MNSSLIPYNAYEAQNAYLRLSASLDKNDPESAIPEIRTFLKMFPGISIAYNDLGVLYQKTGDNLRALAYYEKANRLNPNNPSTIKNIAEFYFAVLGWTDDAIEMLTDLLKSYPDDFEVLTALGAISIKVGRPDEARIFYKKALEIDSSNMELRELLAQISSPVSAAEYRSPAHEPAPLQNAFGKTDEEKAELELQRMIAQNPRNAVALNNLALAKYRAENFTQAASLYEQASAVDPANNLYKKNLADLYYAHLGRTDDAIDIYTSLLKSSPKDTELLTSLAIVSKANNLKEQARTFIRKVIELEPWNIEAREFLSGL
ncbi:MAG: tetratricopeptide repeat protein [Desulfuromonadaceae bacterium]|nr:tetratricopeptide repeat protein [Desulfuromonadaceae bacterium]MDD5104174.1 tetratricopeptide repeat protein [Desulfuromonadaceae bacterium]